MSAASRSAPPADLSRLAGAPRGAPVFFRTRDATAARAAWDQRTAPRHYRRRRDGVHELIDLVLEQFPVEVEVARPGDQSPRAPKIAIDGRPAPPGAGAATRCRAWRRAQDAVGAIEVGGEDGSRGSSPGPARRHAGPPAVERAGPPGPRPALRPMRERILRRQGHGGILRGSRCPPALDARDRCCSNNPDAADAVDEQRSASAASIVGARARHRSRRTRAAHARPVGVARRKGSEAPTRRWRWPSAPLHHLHRTLGSRPSVAKAPESRTGRAARGSPPLNRQ